MVVEGLHVQIGAEPLPALQLLLGPGPADGHGLSRPRLPGCWGEDVGNSIAQRLKLIWSHLFTFDATAVRPFKYLTPSPLADGMCSQMGGLVNLFAIRSCIQTQDDSCRNHPTSFDAISEDHDWSPDRPRSPGRFPS